MHRGSPTAGLEVAAGPLEGHRVRLRPLVPRDYEPLYTLELSEHLGGRWRQLGATPGYERFTQLLWQGVLAQYVVVARNDAKPLGYVTAYDHNARDGTAWLAMAKFDPQDFSGRVLDGLALFVNRLFTSWPLRHLYAESVEHALRELESGAGTLFEVLGRFPERTWIGGEWSDVHLLGCSRERWNTWSAIVLSRVVDGEPWVQPRDRWVRSPAWPAIGTDLAASTLGDDERVPSDPRALADFDVFGAVIVWEFEGLLASDAVRPESRLVDDAGLDSLAMLRLVAVVESFTGAPLPEQLDLGDATFGDLHHYLCLALERADDPPPLTNRP